MVARAGDRADQEGELPACEPLHGAAPFPGYTDNESIISARPEISRLTAGTEACYYEDSFPFGRAPTSGSA